MPQPELIRSPSLSPLIAFDRAFCSYSPSSQIDFGPMIRRRQILSAHAIHTNEFAKQTCTLQVPKFYSHLHSKWIVHLLVFLIIFFNFYSCGESKKILSVRTKYITNLNERKHNFNSPIYKTNLFRPTNSFYTQTSIIIFSNLHRFFTRFSLNKNQDFILICVWYKISKIYK